MAKHAAAATTTTAEVDRHNVLAAGKAFLTAVHHWNQCDTLGPVWPAE
jgi:hypothetical protein